MSNAQLNRPVLVPLGGLGGALPFLRLPKSSGLPLIIRLVMLRSPRHLGVPAMHDDVERLTVENCYLRAERDRLFGLAVAEEQINRPGHVRSRADAIKRVLVWMTTLDLPNPDGEIARALAEHDRRAT